MNELPVGRRVAQWRVRRNMTQQQFADRLGKSKSWVDKVERGARRLERVSSLRAVADALRIDVEVLLADRSGGRSDPAVDAVEGVRGALSRYHVSGSARPPDPAELWARLGHAEQSYRHARYPDLLVLLPGLLDAARAARATRPGRDTDALLVAAYGLTALALVKVGQGAPAWLAADRGMTAALATDDARLAATAAVPLAQALRHGDRPRFALEVALVAAHRLTPAGDTGPATPPQRHRGPDQADESLFGTLLVQAALAAAGREDADGATMLLDQAAELAGAAQDRAAVEAARVVAAAILGDVGAATVRHERLVTGDGWRWLPPEHQAAYLLDVAGAYVLVGDGRRAGRAVLDAERTARGEVHDRPAARDLVAVVARSADAPPDLIRLATTLRVT
ncbi:helix-turn-helix domain-containing protein [Micromonospora sp. WMMD882]|uniref:helix-turn-helix domain-containing protein n=1 Tax=Micromonospora sp. WMMD882 TaxID=3015151 RepID=UPI00248C5C8E|nr:helix-turn-helix domain-containing protein [Micromonospora sp. WMMD882]WBB81597.1 helix-turn-helix domain-containing protein [Micromonospora sp. WMMD882]